MTSRHARDRRVRGTATIEFLIVAFAVLVPLVFATFEIALLAVARQTLGVATLLAARAGATGHGDAGAMRVALARGLVPLHASRGTSAAFAASLADAQRPDRTRLEVWNPVPASFTDFGVVVDGRQEIPNVWSRARLRIGAASRQTIAEANQLGLTVSLCRPLVFPITAPIFIAGLRLVDASPFALACYARGGVVLHARALVHMHSPARRTALPL
ncbi:MAG: TadE/TadG family type IV pilus assembly protein [Steroidobacteraceae bacterium]